MEFFTTTLFSGKTNERAHLQFEKFSRGTFNNRALIEAKCSSGKYSINTSAEFATDFVRAVAEMLGSKKTAVTGVVISTRDLTGVVPFIDKKQFAGVKKYVIETEMTGTDIMALCDKLPRAFIGLSFVADGTELKVKPKAPKAGKPSGNSEDAPKADFCKLKTTNSAITKQLLFDVTEFKQAKISHAFVITDIETPKNEPDPIKMRENAIRKGTLVRKLMIDGKESKKEIVFSA